MALACDPIENISKFLQLTKYSTFFTLALVIYAVRLLVDRPGLQFKSFIYEYLRFFAASFLNVLFLASGLTPVFRSNVTGFQTMGFMGVLTSLNVAWPMIITVFSFTMTLLTFTQLFSVRCLVVRMMVPLQSEEFSKRIRILDYIKKFEYFSMIGSTLALLTFLDIVDNQLEWKSKIAMNCPSFLLIDSAYWGLILNISCQSLMCLTFLLHSIGNVVVSYLVLNRKQPDVSKKNRRIQNRYLLQFSMHITIFVTMLMIPTVLLTMAGDHLSGMASEILVFIIAHHATVNILIFIFFHPIMILKFSLYYDFYSPRFYRFFRCFPGRYVTETPDENDSTNSEVFSVVYKPKGSP